MTRKVSMLLVLVVAIASHEGSASAGDHVVVDVVGEVASEGEGARDAALDVAFSRAVAKAVRDLIGASAAAEHAGAIRKGVRKRARLFVASFRVLSEKAVEGHTRVSVRVTVDRDKLVESLGGLGIEVGRRPAPRSTGSARPAVVVLLKSSGPSGTQTTFGASAGEASHAAAQMARELKSIGFQTVSARGARVPVSGAGDAELPLSTGAAVEMAQSSGAGGAFVVGVRVASEGPIRGTRLFGASAGAAIDVVDAAAGESIASSRVSGAGYGADAESASASAARRAVTAAIRSVTERVGAHWPSRVRASGAAMTVVLRGARSWRDVVGILKKLQRTSGVSAVHPIRARGSRVWLALDTRLSATKIAIALRAAAVAKGSVQARPAGAREVEVTIQGDAAAGFD